MVIASISSTKSEPFSRTNIAPFLPRSALDGSRSSLGTIDFGRPYRKISSGTTANHNFGGRHRLDDRTRHEVRDEGNVRFAPQSEHARVASICPLSDIRPHFDP